MKKAILLLSALLLMAVTASAVDIEYSGEVNPFTGEPGSTVQNVVDTQSAIVPLTNSSWYDREAGCYVYRLSSGGEVRASVANGMVTTGAVSITLPEGANASLYYDGKELADPDYSNIYVPGNYVLSITNSGMTQEPLRFTVVNIVTGRIDRYRMPEHFAVTQMEFNEETVSFSPYEVDMSEEGHYKINYYCIPTGELYELNVNTDHTPPVMKLEAVVDGVAKGPVDISDIESGARISVWQDGKQIAYTSVLKESGAYEVILQDEAGNTTTYKFMIQVYFNFSSMAFFVLVLATAIAVPAYILRARKGLRVR